MINSPFVTVDNFVSPATCEKLIKELSIPTPSLDEQGNPLKSERILKDVEYVQMFKGLLQGLVPKLEQQYNAKVVGMGAPVFTQYYEDPKNPAEKHHCENAEYLRKKWVKVHDIDLVGYLWLKDFHNGVPFDSRFEMYGGKLEFPAYNFSLVPQRGTLIMYPAGPHFITAISPILAGSLEQIKFTIKLKTRDDGMWMYQPSNFPGTYQDWFTQEE